MMCTSDQVSSLRKAELPAEIGGRAAVQLGAAAEAFSCGNGSADILMPWSRKSAIRPRQPHHQCMSCHSACCYSVHCSSAC